MINNIMQYLTNYYKNLCEQLQEKINLIEAELSKKTKDDSKALLDAIAKMDADKIARQNKVNPITGRSYIDVAREASKESLRRASERENFDELSKTMPNLAARMRFSSQSIARSAAPGGSNAYSDLASFGALSPEDQNRVAPTQSSKRLKDMQNAQYKISSTNVALGRGGQPMGDNLASGMGTIDKVLDDRKGPMGGKAGAASFVRSWQEDPTSQKTQQSMALRTPRERIAMLDAMKEEGLRQFREKGRLDPRHVEMVNQFDKFGPKQSETNTGSGTASTIQTNNAQQSSTSKTLNQTQTNSVSSDFKSKYAQLNQEQSSRLRKFS